MRMWLPSFALIASAAIASAVIASAVVALSQGMPKERFENWVFDTPSGWAKRDGPDGLTLTSPDGQAAILLRPGERLSIGLKFWLDGQTTLLEAGMRLVGALEPQTDTAGDGYEVIVWNRALEDAQGRVLRRAYIALNPRTRAELAVFTAFSEGAFNRYASVAGQLVDAARFANVLGLRKPSPQALPPMPVSGAATNALPTLDEYRCYLSVESDDYSNPDFLLQILPDQRYRTAGGGGAFTVAGSGSSTTVRWASGPLVTRQGAASESRAVAVRNEAGLVVRLINAPLGRGGALRDADCYQRGGREAQARLAFARRDPMPGTYRCKAKYGGAAADTLEVLPGRRYAYGGAAGAYAVDIMGDQFRAFSHVRFFGGPLDGGSALYAADGQGRGQFAVSWREELECGPATFTNPAAAGSAGSGSLTGRWSGWVSGGTGYLDAHAQLRETQGRLTGTFTICPFGTCYPSGALTGTRSGNDVRFTATFSDGPITVRATLSGDRMSGPMTIGGSPLITGQLTLVRKP